MSGEHSNDLASVLPTRPAPMMVMSNTGDDGDDDDDDAVAAATCCKWTSDRLNMIEYTVDNAKWC